MMIHSYRMTKPAQSFGNYLNGIQILIGLFFRVLDHLLLSVVRTTLVMSNVLFLQLCMTVNGVEQVRIAMLALPSSLDLDKTPKEGSTSPHDVVKNTDERMCASIRLVADHIGDKVTVILCSNYIINNW